MIPKYRNYNQSVRSSQSLEYEDSFLFINKVFTLLICKVAASYTSGLSEWRELWIPLQSSSQKLTSLAYSSSL